MHKQPPQPNLGTAVACDADPSPSRSPYMRPTANETPTAALTGQLRPYDWTAKMPNDPDPSSDDAMRHAWNDVLAVFGMSVVMQMSATHFKRWLLLRDAARLLPPTSSYYLQHRDQARETVLEIYRAMVTMSHAILEDTLREILRIKLKQSRRTEILERIPFWDPERTPLQPRKLDLSDLAKYRGFTVDHVIERSIDQYLDQTSFSSTDVIADRLKLIQDNIDYAKPFFPTLEEMISRRHQIVHSLDQPLRAAFSPPLTEADCNRWMTATLLFIHELDHQLHPPSNPTDERQYQEFKNELEQFLNTSS